MMDGGNGYSCLSDDVLRHRYAERPFQTIQHIASAAKPQNSAVLLDGDRIVVLKNVARLVGFPP
jgi:hypothetical protein